MNKNFLNNQNYILWKSEKKKVIIKLFIEYHLKFLTMLLNLFSNLIFSGHLLFIAPLLTYYFIFINISDNASKIFFWVIFSVFTLVFFIYPFFLNKKDNNHSISNIKDFFFKKWSNFNIIFILWSIKTAIFYTLLVTYWIDFLKEYELSEFSFFIIFILGIFLWIYLIVRINLLNLLIFPLFIIYLLFYLLLNYLILFKSEILYKVIKKSIIINKFNKFSKISKNNAENKYYIIKIRK